MYLLREAFSIVYNFQEETSNSMKQIKKNLDFLKSTEPKKASKFDMKS